jgi:uncharacterized phage protein gp47/JayE
MNDLWGVTPFGFKAMRLIDVKNELEDLFIGEFGEINLDPQSVTGQLIGIYAKVLADMWENLEDVYLSQYPNSATGISLDNVVQLNGITRLPAQRTSVIGVATGTENTLIPANSLARTPVNGEVFFSTENSFITRGNSVQNIIRVDATVSDKYTVVISGISYIYSLPIINFSGPIVSGNSIDVRINGINIPTITYATSSAATLLALKNAIVANSLGAVSASSSVVGNTIELIPNLGFQIIVNSVNVSGAGAPTYSETFDTPSSVDEVAEYLAANLSSSSNVVGNWVSGNTFTVIAVDSEFPYSLNVGTNLTITQTSSPVPFLSQAYGPIPAPVGSLTDILTPVAGWTSLTNFKAGVTGREQETDVELRLRRLNSLRISGTATVEAIRARLLQEVSGVTSVLVFENVTITQDPITVTFSEDFVVGNNIQVTLDGNNIGTVAWAGTQLATITDIATLISSQPQILDAQVFGGLNRDIEIEMNESQQVIISFNVTDGATQSSYILGGGRPPKSFEAVVEGGSDQDVALKIWRTKPAGIQTFGNVNNGNGIVIVDSQGQNQTIHFSRATPIYLWATIALTLNPQETFPSNGQQLVSESILAFGNSLGIGVDVFIQRVLAQVFTIPGISGAVVQLAKTLNPTDTPTYVSTDIDIGQTEISVWDLGRIFVSI